MSGFSNGLTDAQTERLALLVEECGEVIHKAMKVLRHGYASVNPHDEEEGDNRHQLAIEIGDLEHAINVMRNSRDVSALEIDLAREQKARSIGRWLHHQSAS